MIKLVIVRAHLSIMNYEVAFSRACVEVIIGSLLHCIVKSSSFVALLIIHLSVFKYIYV